MPSSRTYTVFLPDPTLSRTVELTKLTLNGHSLPFLSPEGVELGCLDLRCVFPSLSISWDEKEPLNSSRSHGSPSVSDGRARRRFGWDGSGSTSRSPSSVTRREEEDGEGWLDTVLTSGVSSPRPPGRLQWIRCRIRLGVLFPGVKGIVGSGPKEKKKCPTDGPSVSDG